jgi:hypothetical protein
LRKVKGVLLVGLMYECPSPLRLGSRGVWKSWNWRM